MRGERRQILEQRRHRRSDHFRQRLVRANLIAPHRRLRRGTAHTYSADHLFIDDDGQPAGIRKEAELDLVSLLVWILDYGIHVDLAVFAAH